MLWSHCWVYLRIVRCRMYKRQGKHMERGRVCSQAHYMLGHINLNQDGSKAPVLLNTDMCIHFLLWEQKKLPGNFNFLFYLKIVFFLLILILGLYILILRFQAPTLPRSSLFPHSPKSILLLVLYCYKTDRHLKMGKKGKKIFVCFVLFRNSIHIKQEKQ